jgi:AcrR family transcriptional regulator
MAEAVVERVDRRQLRRRQTIEEVLDVAAEIMVEEGAGGLSLGEVARRMGIRPPSLYVYFDSKNALYDALFARGATAVFEAMRAAHAQVDEQATNLEEALLIAGEAFLRWRVANPGYSQLLFWRPVPGFMPSPEAYAPAVAMVEQATAAFTEMQRRGWIRPDVTPEQLLRDWTVITAGIGSQQLSNAPEESFDEGRFTTRLPQLTAMFARHYEAKPTTPRQQKGRARRAGQR